MEAGAISQEAEATSSMLRAGRRANLRSFSTTGKTLHTR